MSPLPEPKQQSNAAAEDTSEVVAGGNPSKKLALIPLIFLIYFEVAGGPYGEEPAVKAAGPLYAILGFLLFPFIWSVPEALMTAELSTAFPGNGGFVIWADKAFGPFFGSIMGTWRYFSGVINVASLPALCIGYAVRLFPVLASGLPRYAAVVGFTVLFSFLNYTGLAIVGYTSVVLGVVSLAPFVLMSLISIPRIQPRRWLSLGQSGVKKDWNLYLNTLFWNLNLWDNVSTMAGEVADPGKTFPRGLLAAVILTCLGYLLPLMAVTGSVAVDQNQWEAGFMATAADLISGEWLKIWIEVGACLSAIGLYEAQISSSAYLLLGMADMRFLPKSVGRRCRRFNTPWVAILLSTAITLAVSWLDFAVIISAANFLYGLGTLLEFAAFLWLRRKLPTIKRPFRVPVGLPWLFVLCLIPCGFLAIVLVISTKIVLIISAAVTVFGIGLYFLVGFCRKRNLLEFGGDDSDENYYVCPSASEHIDARTLP